MGLLGTVVLTVRLEDTKMEPAPGALTARQESTATRRGRAARAATPESTSVTPPCTKIATTTLTIVPAAALERSQKMTDQVVTIAMLGPTAQPELDRVLAAPLERGVGLLRAVALTVRLERRKMEPVLGVTTVPPDRSTLRDLRHAVIVRPVRRRRVG